MEDEQFMPDVTCMFDIGSCHTMFYIYVTFDVYTLFLCMHLVSASGTIKDIFTTNFRDTGNSLKVVWQPNFMAQLT